MRGGTCLAAALALLTACGEMASPPDAGAGADAAGYADGGAGLDAARAPDAGECVAITELEGFRLDVADDTGLRARARMEPPVEGERIDLILWFQRFAGADFTGAIELGAAPNESFPDCPHCVFAGDALDFTRGYFASEGELTLQRNPFGGRLDLTLDGVILREIVVEAGPGPIPAMRSRFVEGGGCIVLPRLTVSAPLPSPDWRCDAELWADGEGCDCECGAWDPDCDPCDPFQDPTCDPSATLPDRRCDAGAVCLFEAEEGVCAQTCDDAPCGAGFCAHWPTGDRVCVTDPDRVSAVAVGEVCAEGAGLRYCAVDAGVAGGVCAEWLAGSDGEAETVFECWEACDGDADCGAGLTCVALGADTGDDPPGYCQPPHPRDWSCDPSAWEDGVCDCRCGVWDPDCGDATLHVPEPSARCAAEEVCVRENPFLFGSEGECVRPPENDTCATAAPLPLDADTRGTTRGAAPRYDATGCFEGGVPGAEVVYAVELALGDALSVTVTPDAENPVLYLVGPGDPSVCDGELACAATGSGGGRGEPETLIHTATEAGTHYLVVDADPFDFAFTLRASVTPAG